MISYHVALAPMSDAVPEAVIAHYTWENNGFQPYASARLSLWEDRLFVRLVCREKDPLIRCHHGPDGPVWLDSCLEFFFCPAGCDRYLNLEMNGGGGFFCAIGPARYSRTFCDPFAPDGQPRPTVRSSDWQVDAILSLPKLRELFGRNDLSDLRGNFYKCGDETPFPHYGMWSPVDLPSPDFHRPEFFAPILLPGEKAV